VYLLLFVTAAAMVLSVLYLVLARSFTRMIMHITLVLAILLNMCVLSFSYAYPQTLQGLTGIFSYTAVSVSTTGSPDITVRSKFYVPFCSCLRIFFFFF
jgi:hypothetical protein